VRCSEKYNPHKAMIQSLASLNGQRWALYHGPDQDTMKR